MPYPIQNADVSFSSDLETMISRVIGALTLSDYNNVHMGVTAEGQTTVWAREGLWGADRGWHINVRPYDTSGVLQGVRIVFSPYNNVRRVIVANSPKELLEKLSEIEAQKE